MLSMVDAEVAIQDSLISARMDAVERGLLTDRTVRRVEPEQRELTEDDRRYSKRLKTVGRSFRNVKTLSPSFSSYPVILSCILVGTIFLLLINQYFLGSFHCNMTILNLKLFYSPSTAERVVSDSPSEPGVLFSNHIMQVSKKGPHIPLVDDGHDNQEATTRQLTVTGDPITDEGDLARAESDEFSEYGSSESNVSLHFGRDTLSGKISKVERLDTGMFSYVDDSRIASADNVDKQLVQAGTSLLAQSEADEPHFEPVAELQVKKSSRYRNDDNNRGKFGELDAIRQTGLAKSNVSMEKTRFPAECDIFSGRWVYDETYPLYPPSSCPFVDEGFSCANNGRPDTDYLKWRWQPYDCDLPRFNGTDMLERLRNKRMTFVGDSLGRNQWESMLCLLYHAAPNKSRVVELNGEQISKHQHHLTFRYSDFNATVEFYRAPFLVHQGHKPADAPPFVKTTLHVDYIDSTAKKWNRADMLIFNTGHWWTYAKTLRGHCYFAKGNQVVNLEILEAFEQGLRTWAEFVDQNIDAKKTRVFYRSFSPTHFRGGQWNTGGQCSVETTPYTNRSRNDLYHPPTEKVRIAEAVISRMKTPVTLLNATELTDYRRDGHPSRWTQTAGTYGAGVNGSRYQDCSHWCLPGVPDTWNELLYASLLMHHKPHYDLSSRSHGSIRQHKKKTIRIVTQKTQPNAKANRAA
ncbi:hypothetical protein R1sor_012037 [Riccia sorocarpa]|uniref:Trichome birefringence-like N-terminal domain-containing protein n=1 Tax=Riccia sorocarpa TaxID=122646 RepID=A0ABD3I6V0_9MARC